MTLTIARWTVDEYHQLVETGLLAERRLELLNGVIVEMSPEGKPHAALSTRARDYLTRLLSDRAIVREGHPITLPSSNSEPEPDLAIVQPLDDEYFEHHPYPENIFWVIEYSDSSLNNDLETKSQIYAEAPIFELVAQSDRAAQRVSTHPQLFELLDKDQALEYLSDLLQESICAWDC